MIAFGDSRLPARFWDRVIPEPNSGCWLWSGYTVGGYGKIRWDGKRAMAHRVSYAHLRGAIPGGLEIDHLCRVTECVNPEHLEAVTHAENMRRGFGAPHAMRTRTHCPSGHEYSEENTGLYNGWRYCRTCNREGVKRRYHSRYRDDPEAKAKRNALSMARYERIRNDPEAWAEHLRRNRERYWERKRRRAEEAMEK